MKETLDVMITDRGDGWIQWDACHNCNFLVLEKSIGVLQGGGLVPTLSWLYNMGLLIRRMLLSAIADHVGKDGG